MQVGQQVWVYEGSYRKSKIKEAVVTKVGKKYFEVDKFRGRFFIESLLEDAGQYTATSRVYLSLKDYEDEREISYLAGKLRDFNFKGLSLEQLRQINKTIQDAGDN